MNTIHTVIHLGISAPDYETMPTLILFPEGVEPHASFIVARYARYLQKEGHASYATVSRDLHYIGLLFDYYYLVVKPNAKNTNDWEMFIEDFLSAFDKGAVLGWRAAKTADYTYCKNTTKQFCQFVSGLKSSRKLLPAEEKDLEYSINRSYEYCAHLKTSLLFHIKRKSHSMKDSHKSKERGRRRAKSGATVVKYFPPEYVPLLIEETTNVRDKIILLMAAYGGRRQCEIIQILINDVEPVNGRLHVTLAHPETSSMSWLCKAGKKRTGTRGEFLKTMYGLKPRINLGALSSSAGWKGIKYDDKNTETSIMWFIREEVERYLLTLHIQYMEEVRGEYSHHPYYFVNQNGDPMTQKSMSKAIDNACKRLEKKYGINLDGRRGHSLRHHYGFYCADVLQMDLLMIRKYMGHKQLSSTAIYTHISPEKARQVIQNAQDKAKLEDRIDADIEERLQIQQRFENQPAIAKLPNSWMTSWLTGEEIDTMLIHR
ncbi:hypothetical protein ACS85_02445 [Vibrio parahaemolyticus]|uniref:tyrosine-type recombinase/integrase n=1 Tax=Vibrio parahaemolyticus TaxID=670 RepID=UPI0006A6A82B|nr:site-specific integrase [Vibrio parahaemolyticus]KOE19678.1 hypothetical protein ACS85_02445 [Vibrio parahaemolyticus]